MPTTSSLVDAMSVEELRSFSQVLANISLELSNDAVAPTIEGGGGGQICRLFHTQVVYCWTSLPYPIFGEAVSALH